jgi:D-xylose transport system substrate-binding protein
MNSLLAVFTRRAVIITAVVFASYAYASKEKPVIGLSLDALKDERWQRDRDTFVAGVEKLGGIVVVRSAQSDDATQVRDIQSLVKRGVDAIVVIPHNASTLGAAIKSANAAKIPVISYDRLILDADIACYISFDNIKVGEAQARYVATRFDPSRRARIVRIYGAPTDNNAHMFKQGQDNILNPLIAAGKVEVVYEDWATDWSLDVARNIMTAALNKSSPPFDAVIASNDSTAGGAIEAMTAFGGSFEKTLVTGQDADLAACVRIKAGTQAMTVYKPLDKLALLAARTAVDLARGNPLSAASSIENGFKSVPAIWEEGVISVDKANIDTTVVADRFHSRGR